jgi:hypothetical protein
MITLKELVGGNVTFSSYRAGFFYYSVGYVNQEKECYETYQFPVPIEDIGNATLNHTDKAITFMRWIRKAIDEKTLLLVSYTQAQYDIR